MSGFSLVFFFEYSHFFSFAGTHLRAASMRPPAASRSVYRARQKRVEAPRDCTRLYFVPFKEASAKLHAGNIVRVGTHAHARTAAVFPGE